eukprot:5727173-Pyramimonas_sp.AAC.1
MPRGLKEVVEVATQEEQGDCPGSPPDAGTGSTHPSQAPHGIAGSPFQVEVAEGAYVRPPSLWGQGTAPLPWGPEVEAEQEQGRGEG